MAFVGKYERESAENFDEFLKALNVPSDLRAAASASTPVMEITEENGGWTIKTSTAMRSSSLKFEIGKEFDETTPDGRQVKAIVTKDGNRLISIQTAVKEGVKSTKVVRDFSDERVVQTMEIIGTDVTCTQVYKRA